MPPIGCSRNSCRDAYRISLSMDSAPANIAAVSIDIVYFTEDPES
jgi:hypothetical protein